MDDELSEREFCGIRDNTFRVLRLAADQWGEHGYFFDPVAQRYGFYEIDRKDQCDRVVRYSSADALRAALPVAHRASVEAWLL